jgi:hypothetical protein
MRRRGPEAATIELLHESQPTTDHRSHKETPMLPSPASATSLTIEVEVEDAGHTSVLRSVLTTLSGQHGTQLAQFVARTTDTSEPPAVVATSSTFPVSPLALMEGQDAAPDGGWPDEARAALEELDTALVGEGWQCTATGTRWWNRRYTREAG